MNNNKKYTLDNNTTASNPGVIILNPLVWAKYNIKNVTLLFTSLLVSVLLSVFISYYLLIFVIISVLINTYYWLRSKEHFTADSNGGIIVSTNPPLAAVSTNLAKYGDDYPAIKIIKYNVKKDIIIGDKIGTVAVYSEGEDDELDYWDDFFPIPIEYATNNKDSIELEIQSYPKEQWEAIRNGVNQITKPYQIGLYHVDKDCSDWSSA